MANVVPGFPDSSIVLEREAFRPRSSIRRLLGLARRKPLGAISALVIAALVVIALTAPFISPYDPLEPHAANSLNAPGGQFLLGTDELGRDVLSRVLWGARISLWVGIVAVGLGTISGVIWGTISGYFGGKTDLVIQRIMDVVMSIPMLVLALSIVAVLGPSTTNVMLALAVVMTPTSSRVVRSSVLSASRNQYVEAARIVGCRDVRIILRHVLPNILAPVIVVATVGLGTAVISEASLSFLGVGTPPPTPTWGGMLSGPARRYMQTAPWMALVPGLAISLVVLSFNMLGDALRDILDPYLRTR